ncbi:MAG: PAS domain S-box protein [Verrucomicrobiota bacterium]
MSLRESAGERPTREGELSEIMNLRRTVRDLVALSALPAIWVESDLRNSLKNLTDVLRAALRATAVCMEVQLPDGTRFEAEASTNLGKTSKCSDATRGMFDVVGMEVTELVPLPNGNESGPVNALPFPIVWRGAQVGRFIACFACDVCPEENERLLLEVAANQVRLLFDRQKRQEKQWKEQWVEKHALQLEQQYGQLLNGLPVAVYACDCQGRITWFNEAAAELWGRRPRLGEEAWCGSWKIFHPDGSPMAHEECPMAIALREGRSIRGREILVERPDGTRSFVLPHPDPVRDESGAIVGMVNMLVVMDDLKRAEEKLRASEARWLSLLTMLPAAVYTCDAEGRITFFNHRAAELWGREPKLGDLDQKFCGAFRLWNPDGSLLPHEETPMAAALRRRTRTRSAEVVIERPDGTRVAVSVNIDPLYDRNGQLEGAINVFLDISNLKQAEGKLRAREQHLRAIIDNTPECVMLIANDGVLLQMNPVGLRMVEADSAKEVVGKSIERLIDQGWLGAFRNLHEAVCGGDKQRSEFLIAGLKGARRWVETHSAPINDLLTGQRLHLAVARDISERREVERQLRESELRFRSLVNSVEGIVWECAITADGFQFTFVSEQAERLLGYPVDQWLTEKDFWIRHIHPEDREWAAEFCRSRTREQKDHEFEYRMISASGRPVWLRDIVTVISDGNKAVKLVGVMVDVTERKRAEEAIEENRIRTRLIIDKANDAFVSFDEQGVIQDWNPQAEQIFGWSRAEALGLPLPGTIIPAESLEAAGQGFKQFLETGEGPFFNKRREMMARHRNGHEFPVELTITPVRLRDRYVFNAFLHDITERKRSEQALQERTRSLEMINRVGNTLAGELDLSRLVQSVTDAAREVCGAAFGAFFYNVQNEQGESYMLYTLSGVSRDAFARFPMPRNTALFNPTFQGEGVVRVGDVLQDPRYGKNPPHHGMPKGHLPVRSYLAVPVVSRSGKVLGGLFFGHPAPNIFTEEAEKIISAIAAQAAIALDNAQLYQEAQKEIADRKRAEHRLQLLSEILAELLNARAPEMIVRELFPRVAAHVRADCFVHFMINEQGNALLLHACEGLPSDKFRELQRFAFPETLCGTVAQSRQPICLADLQQSTEPKAQLVRSLGLQCYACHPLVVGDRLIGTLSFGSRSRKKFEEDELQFLRIVSQYTAVALERLQSAKRLRESEERFRTVVDNSTTVIYVKDREGKYLLINKCYERLFHITEPEILGKTDFEIFPAEAAQKFRDNDLTVFHCGEALELEEVAPHDDGPHTYISIKFPLRQADGTVYAVAGISTDITERKRAESLLLGQKETLQLIVEDAPLAEIMEKLIEVIETRSPGALGTVLLLDEDGVNLRPFAGKRSPAAWNEFISPVRVGPCAGSCGTAAYRNEPVVVTDIAVDPLWKDFKEAALPLGFRACWSIPIRSSGGRVLGTFACYYFEPRRPTDLEWKVMEILSQTAALAIERQQTQEARRKLSVLVEHSPNFVGVADLNQQTLFLNPAGCEMVGLEPQEVSSMRILDYFPESERARIQDEIMPILLRRGHWDGEVYFRHFKSGALIPVMWNVFVIPDSKTNAPAFFACVSTDISERKQAEEALRRSETLFRELADSMPQIVWAARPDGGIDYFNKRWYEYTGFPEEALGEQNWDSILHPDDVQRYADIYYGCIREERLFQIEYRFKDRQTGGYRWFLGRALPIRDAQGRVIRWFGTCTDIDDQKRAEEKLEKAVAERTASLRDLVQQMEEFSYTISHDLRAPLRAMQAYSQALLEDFGEKLGGEAAHYLDRLVQNSTRLDKMILDVLTFSRIARTELKLERVSLDKLVRELVQHYPAIQTACALIEIEPLEDVYGHEPSLTQAVSNLVSNAVKFVPPGLRPRIRIWTERRDQDVRLWVEDNGIGIDPRYQHRLFNMFERLHPKLNYEGTGVGLAIVRKAVERMNGRVGLESDGILGSRFWIQIRAADAIKNVKTGSCG